MAIMCGGLGLVAGIWTIAKWSRYGTLEHSIGLIMFAAAILAIWGSRRYLAKSENYKMAILFGGVCSIICGMLLGIIPLILILISKKEFEDIPPALRDN